MTRRVPLPGTRPAPARFAQALRRYARRPATPLHTPGHKGRRFLPGLSRWLTEEGLACDLPAMDETGNWLATRGPLAAAQRDFAAECGSAQTWFLANGSSSGVHAMLLASVGPGDAVLLSRHSHLSAFAALVLSGAAPVYLPARWSAAAGPVPPDGDEVARALEADPRIRAVLLTSPSYYGIGRPLAAVARACRRRGVPLLVDEAHGAHLPFLPPAPDLLGSALGAGADLVVQSPHKTLGSLVGTACLHRTRGGLVAPERVQAALALVTSTSPSYLLLASLDLCRRWLATRGRAELARAVARARRLREAIRALEPLRPLGPGAAGLPADVRFDPLRLVVDVSGTGLSGHDAERHLLASANLLDEFADEANVVCVLGPADPPAVLARLLRAFDALRRGARGRGRPPAPPSCWPLPPQALTPRAACSRPSEAVPLAEARGRIVAEPVCQYPPGIPWLVPGERVGRELVERLREARRQPCHFTTADASLRTLRVVRE